MKNKLLACMCLAAVLGLGACGGPNNININNKRLKENEKLYVYCNDSSNNYSVLATCDSTSASIIGSFGSININKQNAKIYYTITSSYVSLEMKDKTSQERQAKYTYTSPHLSYCLVTKE